MLAWQQLAMEPVNREIWNKFGKLTVFKGDDQQQSTPSSPLGSLSTHNEAAS
jgi:hypothetical protein